MTKMTRDEFISELESALKRNGIRDTDDIVGEYREHFAFKLADGYSEEEIAAKLGKPEELAAQFENEGRTEKHGGRRFAAALGLAFTDVFAAMGFILLWAWETVMAAAMLSFAAAAVCLIGGIHGDHILIPAMPYWCGAIMGLSLAALSVLTCVGCIYVAAFIVQLMRAFRRFAHNTMASASGKPVLPPIPVNPQLPVKKRRALRRLALVSLSVFGACFVLGMIVSMLSAHAVQFWHAWGWFGYKG
jgi:uncharacterized membrane protein